jgi:protein O-GlcNAc transferase
MAKTRPRQCPAIISIDAVVLEWPTTNCDCFIMGVPVLSLTGSRHVSRVTTSQLHALDLDLLITSDRDQYVETAVRLASNMTLLSTVRQGLRERLLKSALMDYRGFTRQLETRYQEIWRAWCSDGTGAH